MKDLYRSRKQLVHLVSSQDEVRDLVSRLVRGATTLVIIAVALLTMGFKGETILISGAALLSSFTVILGTVYTSFIQGVLFVCFVHPYNVGDRVVIDQQTKYVKRIGTYYTRFESLQGKQEILSHQILFNKVLLNESRNRIATLEIPLLIAWNTPSEKWRELIISLWRYVENHYDYRRDGFWPMLLDYQHGDWIKLDFWIDCVEGWGQWIGVYSAKQQIFRQVTQACKSLGITYVLPTRPVDIRMKKET